MNVCILNGSFYIGRCNIVTEIAQATAISTVKRSKGMDLEQEFTPLGPTKVDLLQVQQFTHSEQEHN